MTLKKEDLTNFLKRLRLLCPTTTLKYYAVGEYGSENERPHYHLILFNVMDTKRIQDAWTLSKRQIGNAWVGTVTGASVAYCLKYIDKEKRIPKHQRDDRLKEYSVMSKGLGDNYLTDAAKKYHNADINRNYITLKDGHKIALPRYYRLKLYDQDTIERQTDHIIKTTTQQKEEHEKQFIDRNPGSDQWDYWDELKRQKDERLRRFRHRATSKPRKIG